MFSSIKLGKPFGIDLYVHSTFWLLPLFIFYGGVASGNVSDALFDVAVLFAIFGCVVLHEVGHALAAKWYGISTRDITLYPVGGVARLERMPERPWHEIVVALAGPAVNLMIVAGLFLGDLGGSYVLPDSWISTETNAAELFVGRLFLANLGLLLFNLIPAFPMDGGRVLRAVLSFRMSRLDATRAAVTVGSILAAAGFIYGLINLQFMWMLLAGVIYLLGKAELTAIQIQEYQKRRRQEGHESFEEVFEEPEGPRGTGQFTGWRWDPARRVWSEWRGGILQREVRE